ncbi:MAG: FtsK/SpoIIIE domain-containing protein [Ruminococcus sp.]
MIEKPDAGQLEKFAVEYHKAVEKLNVQSIHFEEILPPEPFQGSTAKVLKLPMGIGDGDSVVSMVFGEGTSHHGLIGGGTGGGKSTLLHTLIMSSMMNYSPEQLNLYLMDFKGGTEFKIYESERLPHTSCWRWMHCRSSARASWKIWSRRWRIARIYSRIRRIYKAGRLCYQYRKQHAPYPGHHG